MTYTAMHYTKRYHSIMIYSTVQYTAMHCTAIQYNTIQYNTIQYSAIHCTALQYTILDDQTHSKISSSPTHSPPTPLPPSSHLLIDNGSNSFRTKLLSSVHIALTSISYSPSILLFFFFLVTHPGMSLLSDAPLGVVVIVIQSHHRHRHTSQ